MRVCLILGSTQSPHGWDLLVKELMAWGVEVTAVDLPVVSKGAAFFAEEVARQMPQGEPPVVVAHSMAGLVLPVVPEFMKVAGLVYLAAVVPKPNVSLLEQYQEAKEMFQPDWPGQDPTANPESAERFLFHDCEPRVRDWALTTLRLWAPRALLEEPCHLRQLPEASYISATQDRALNPDWWERAAEQGLGVKPVRIDSGHCPHVSRPRDVARLLRGVLV